VTEAKLTPAGRRFFSRQSGSGVLLLQQHHRRAVASPPRGFYELLAGNQCFLSHNNAILTFQGHPEKDAQCAKLRIRDVTRWFGVDQDDKAGLAYFERAMERPDDSAEIWARILEWAREIEKHPTHEVRL
jgi:GMP synthase-like glutamine amidotransferase